MARLPPSPEIDSRTPSATFLSHMERGKLSPMVEGKHSPMVGEKFSTFEEELVISPTNVQKVVAELIGTFILMFIGCGSAFVDQRNNITLVGVAFAWALVVTAMIYTLGHISGAHFNPAVTIAFATTGRFPWKQVPLYVVAQVVGAILASVVLRWLFNGDRADVMLTLPAASFDDLTVVAWEIIVSFILMWVICGAASDHRAIKELSGAAVGAAIFIDVLIAGKVTGASMNPARSIGPAVATHNFNKIWIYLVAPVIGTTAASSLYNLLRLPEGTEKKTVKHVSGEIKSRLNPTFTGKSMELP